AGTPAGEGETGGAIEIWDVAARDRKAVLKGGPKAGINSLVFARDGKVIVSGGGEWAKVGELGVWDVSGEQPPVVHTRDRELIESIALSPDGTRLAVCGGQANVPGHMSVCDVSAGLFPVTLKGHANFVSAAAFAPDGKTLATASWDHTVRLWDAA